jgi:hypothetical protein
MMYVTLKMEGSHMRLGCGCLILVLIFNLTIGAVAFDYTLWCLLAKDVPWWADMICGAVTAEIIVPAAVICWILCLAGMSPPFIGG